MYTYFMVALTMDISDKGHLRNLAIAAVNFIPVAGGAVGFLLDKYVPDYLAKQRLHFLSEIEAGLVALNEKGIETNIGDNKFLATLVRCIQIADGELGEERLKALRGIVLNSALPTEQEFDERSLFIRLVEMLTADQIRILKAIHNDSTIFLDADADVYNVLANRFPEIDRDYIAVCAQELVSWNLIASRGGANGYRQVKIGYIPVDDRTHYLTRLGERFISFITAPYDL